MTLPSRATAPLPLDRGVWGILATPFGADGEVDTASLRRQVELFAATGARGVVALGVFGEAARLQPDERRHVAQEAMRTAQAHGLGVIIGITALERDATIAQGRVAADVAVEVAGAAALEPGGLLRGLMVQVPTAEPRLLLAHLQAVHDATAAGIVVQDYPRSSGVSVAADVLASAVADAPFVVAVKAESTPTAPAVSRLVSGCRVPVFGGLGGVALVDELAAGAAGAMTGFSFPEGLVATIAAFDRGGVDDARATWARWLPLAVFEQQDGLALAIRKELLRRRGVITEASVRPPALPFPALLEPMLVGHLADAERRLVEDEH